MLKDLWETCLYLDNFMTLASDSEKILILKSFQELIRRSSVVLKRQLANFLDGRVWGGVISEDLLSLLNTCPLINLAEERLFGDLDFDMMKRRHESTHHRSTINVWKHNTTAQ